MRPATERVIVYGRNYETNIKKQKGPAEARKAKITRKHLGAITLAVREGGPDEGTNSRLKTAIRLALKDNVPRTTVDKRIKKFIDDKETIDELCLSGYASGGAAVMISVVTDSTARCRTEVREAFKDANGKMGNDGAVDHCFTKQGVLRFEGTTGDAVMEAALEVEAEVEDCFEEGDEVVVTTLPENLHSSVQALEGVDFELKESGLEYVPQTEAILNEEGTYETLRLLHLLEGIDDVQDVHHNGVLKEGVELMFSPYGIPFSFERAQKG